MRFLTLFIEKVPTHPEFKEVPVDVKKANKEKMTEILTLTEKLKSKLLERYKKEYEQFLIDQEIERKKLMEEEEKKRKEREDAARNKPANSSTIIVPSAPDFGDLDQIVYPNDFPDPSSTKPPSSGLLPGNSAIKPPVFDRTTKPSISLIEGGLRSILIPDDTMRKFLDVARTNTLKNVETCAILGGKLQQHILTVTHIIIPKQTGTSDSCNTMNEEEIFDIQDQLQLITIAWIHTHPSQTAFLSSVDLHTQYGYQAMMPEAIAIVCSPKYEEVGFFSLTSSGLDEISKCPQNGFHPHSNNLFSESSHYALDKTKSVTIVDLRVR
jgi:STAM-binding protein